MPFILFICLLKRWHRISPTKSIGFLNVNSEIHGNSMRGLLRKDKCCIKMRRIWVPREEIQSMSKRRILTELSFFLLKFLVVSIRAVVVVECKSTPSNLEASIFMTCSQCSCFLVSRVYFRSPITLSPSPPFLTCEPSPIKLVRHRRSFRIVC